MNRRYASDTEVSADRSLGQIQAVLKAHGGSRFAYGEDDEKFMIGFQMQDRRYRFLVPLPQATDDDICYTPTGKERVSGQVQALLEQGRKQRFRALLLVLKAKLEAVECGITSLEDEFLGALVLGSGETLAEWARPQLEASYRLGSGPSLLALGSGEER